MAALRGLVLTRQSDAAKLLVDAMRQGNAELAASAIAMIDLVQGFRGDQDVCRTGPVVAAGHAGVAAARVGKPTGFHGVGGDL